MSPRLAPRPASIVERKVVRIRTVVSSAGLDVDIEVDGGIGPDTIGGGGGGGAAKAGANVLVAGRALQRDPDGLGHAVADLRPGAETARAAVAS
ncbi:hypothetical protein [Iamia sp.]|uniref:hypothetical protein n=1 Tax=Iamia sp. TaxID=2722710 RepID=UPI002CE256EB|nr:hypothetical protein [Iamia sp.]HXH58707.1 hypothetical protein [Iamia sp.]